MSRWFRHYAGMMRDEKLVRVAIHSHQPIERVVWVWGAILESAAEVNDGGRYDIDIDEASYFLRVEDGAIQSIVDGLECAGRLEGGRVAKWKDRQYESDVSTDRVRKHRAKKDERSETVDETELKRFGNAPETETETDTETETEKKDIRAVAKATRPSNDLFDEFWKVYPKRQGANPSGPARKKWDQATKSGVDPGKIIKAIKSGIGFDPAKIGTEFIPRASTWLSERRWEDYRECVEIVDIPGHYAAFGSEQLEAWSAYERASGKSHPRDKNGGWRFPTEWPPGHQSEAA